MPRALGKVILVTTSHVAEESLRKVEKAMERERPDCVGVELDPARFLALKSRGSSPPLSKVGLGGYLVFWIMKSLQEWFGKRAGIMPGSEMLKAIELSREKGIKWFFLDRPIQDTFLAIKGISAREKLKLVWILVKGVTVASVGGVDLKKVPEDQIIREAMSFLEKELPGFYRVLVEERDRHMAHQLLHLRQEFKKVMAVVGAGHREGIIKMLSK